MVKELLVEYGKRFSNSKMRAVVSGAVSSVIDKLKTRLVSPNNIINHYVKVCVFMIAYKCPLVKGR